MKNENKPGDETPASAPIAQMDAKPAKLDKPKGKRGRPALISDKAFGEVHSKSKSLVEIVQAFAILRSMEPAKAKLYVSMRSAAMRKKGIDIKLFPRGRPKGSVNAPKEAKLPEMRKIEPDTEKATEKTSARAEAKALMEASSKEFVDTPEGRANDGMCNWDDDGEHPQPSSMNDESTEQVFAGEV